MIKEKIDLDRIILAEATEEERFKDISKLCGIRDIDNVYMIIDKYTREVYGIIEYRKEEEGDNIHIDLIEVWKENREQGIARRVIEDLNSSYSITGDSILESIGFWSNIGAEFDEDIEDEEVIEYYRKECLCVPFIIN